MLGIDIDDIPKINEPVTEPDYDQDIGAETPNRDRDLIEDFTENNYGYSANEAFINQPVKKLSNEPLDYFGYSYFSGQSRPLRASNSIPIPTKYIIGPNDIIKVILYGNKSAKYDLKVSRDGEIFFPEIGPLYVSGLSFQDTQELIKSSVSSQFIGTDVSLTLGALKTIDIFILGAVNNPGMHRISAFSNITNAIFESGGVDKSGSLRNIKLKRNGEIIAQLDLYKLFLNGDATEDQRLMQGDVIFIEPLGKTAAVRGEVNRPGIFELIEGETITELLNYAGNAKARASMANVELTRINQSRNSYDLIKLDLNSSNLDIPINDGDMVSFYPVNDKLQNAVLISGHTVQPGFYPWKEGMKILDLIKSPDYLLDFTDVNYTLILRKSKIGQKYSLYQVDLEEAFKDDNSPENITLFDNDEILLLPSLLTPEFITTKLVREKSANETGAKNIIFEEEYNSLTYLRNSLASQSADMLFDETSTPTQYSDYYEYSIFGYCNLPKDLVEKLLSPDTLEISYEITATCRKQLINPIIDLLLRDSENELARVASLFGGVHFGGQYPYTEGMSILDLIKAGGGTVSGSYDGEIEIITNEQARNTIRSTRSFTSLDEADLVKLTPMDLVSVKQLDTKIEAVEIEGEVYFPGVYPISKGQTISELITRAGGLKPSADIGGAIFLRKEIREDQIRNIKVAQIELEKKIMMASADNIGDERLDDNNIMQLLQMTETEDEELSKLGRLIIDLEDQTSSSANIKLEDDDSLFIPRDKQVVNIIGEVKNENSQIYQPEFTIDQYIQLSGGYTESANASAVYIIKSDGSVVSTSDFSSGFFRGASSKLESGDTIVVPPEISRFSQIKAATEITQIIYQMAIAAAAVNSF